MMVQQRKLRLWNVAHRLSRMQGAPFCRPMPNRRLTGKAWNEEWRRLGLGAVLEHEKSAASLNCLMFVQCGFGCDQHGDRVGKGATSAAVVRTTNFLSPGTALAPSRARVACVFLCFCSAVSMLLARAASLSECN